MSGHTPGPWRVGDAGATVFGPPNGHPSPETVAHVTHKANSHLIAAAPDMLAALERLLELIGETYSPEPLTRWNVEPERTNYRTVVGARAAIARARGVNADRVTLDETEGDKA